MRKKAVYYGYAMGAPGRPAFFHTWGTKKYTEETRKEHVKAGFCCGPVIRIEVPIHWKTDMDWKAPLAGSNADYQS